MNKKQNSMFGNKFQQEMNIKGIGYLMQIQVLRTIMHQTNMSFWIYILISFQNPFLTDDGEKFYG